MHQKREAVIAGDHVYIPLTRGLTAIVDIVDADLADFNWWATASGYAARTVMQPRKRTIFLHLVVADRAGLKAVEKEVDHRDLDKMNCRRENLRPATSAQNKCNRGKHGNNTSGHKGVFWDKVNRKWRTLIGVNGRYVHLGRFEDRELAEFVYEEAAIRYHGDFARVS